MFLQRKYQAHVVLQESPPGLLILCKFSQSIGKKKYSPSSHETVYLDSEVRTGTVH